MRPFRAGNLLKVAGEGLVGSSAASRAAAPSIPGGPTPILSRTDGGGVAGRRCGAGRAERPSAPRALAAAWWDQRRAPALSD